MYIIRKGDHCTCVFFDPFNHTVTDRPSNDACTESKLQVLIVLAHQKLILVIYRKLGIALRHALRANKQKKCQD